MFKFISSCLLIRKEKKSVKQVICLELPYLKSLLTIVLYNRYVTLCCSWLHASLRNYGLLGARNKLL